MIIYTKDIMDTLSIQVYACGVSFWSPLTVAEMFVRSTQVRAGFFLELIEYILE